MSYSSEIWGYHQGSDIKRVHTRYLRYLLGVKRSTNLSALYSELGRKPLIIYRQLRMLKYWIKLRNTNDPLLKSMFNMLTTDVENDITYNGLNKAFQIKCILDKLGLSNLWNTPLNTQISYHLIKQRLLDQYNQTLTSDINNSNRLRLYKRFKENNEYEKYLDVIKNRKMQRTLSRFRMSSHDLTIEIGRHIGSERHERLCKKCNMNLIEDEYHFLLVCPHYTNIRRKYLPRYYCRWPNLHKFSTLMSSKSERIIIN